MTAQQKLTGLRLALMASRYKNTLKHTDWNRLLVPLNQAYDENRFNGIRLSKSK